MGNHFENKRPFLGNIFRKYANYKTKRTQQSKINYYLVPFSFLSKHYIVRKSFQKPILVLEFAYYSNMPISGHLPAACRIMWVL